MRSLIALLTLCVFAGQPAFAQNRHDWQQCVMRLHPGDHLHLALKTGPTDATFVSSSADGIVADSGTMKREDVLKIERVSLKGHGSRLKHVLIGAAIGGGAGAGIGAAVGGAGSCEQGSIVCFSSERGLGAAIVGAAGSVVGAVVGALLPASHGKRETIYSVN